jgi:CheY-like chemotaxis protein
MPEDERPTVLVVDDEQDVAEAYALWLSGDYDVRTAHHGQEALEQMDDDVDVILLDRRMPRMSGDEVLQEITKRRYDCLVGMVTAVEPDYDIVDMEFDEYLTKPVTRQEINDTVEGLLALDDRHEDERRAVSLANKRSALESYKNDRELDDERYRELLDRSEDVEQ